jgi:hypothetical protein
MCGTAGEFSFCACGLVPRPGILDSVDTFEIASSSVLASNDSQNDLPPTLMEISDVYAATLQICRVQRDPLFPQFRFVVCNMENIDLLIF